MINLNRLRMQFILRRLGLLPFAWRLRHYAKMRMDASFRRREGELRREYGEFRRRYGASLGIRLNQGLPTKRKALVVSVGFPSGAQAELGLIKGLEMAGFSPVVLCKRDPWLRNYYRLAGVEKIHYWDEFTRPVSGGLLRDFAVRLRSFEKLLSLEYKGARVGRIAASTLFRNLRIGSLDLSSFDVRRVVLEYLTAGMAHAAAAQELLDQVQPQIVMFVDRGYTPQGELFDICVARGVDTITWNAAHKGNALILKRYRMENRDEHPASLSEDSWDQALRMPWTEEHQKQLQQELSGTYASGDWYSEVGTQFRTRIADPMEIRKRLGLDPAKKTAVIFPHILWDGTFFWGKDLFRSYEEWFIQTVRAACANPAANWVIKIHPANLVKNSRDGIIGEPSEVLAIRKHIGALPAHIFLIPADSDINTFSLFGVMDYCLTVRGTIGIEAASFGIPVLTAGTGRFDHQGFTIDSKTLEEYLEKVSRIQEIPRLTSEQWERAQRFAYFIFLRRPLLTRVFTLEYRKDAKASIQTKVNAQSREDWLRAEDLRSFSEWLLRADRIDYLAPPPGGQSEDLLGREASEHEFLRLAP